MAGQDKAAVAYSIAITAIFIGIAVSMSAVQDAGPTVSAPVMVEKPVVKAEPEKTVNMEEKVNMAAEKAAAEKAAAEKAAAEKAAAEKAAASAKPKTHNVEIPVGTSVLGCETSNACYSPADVTVKAGDTIVWDNVDSAVHTVTAGTPADAKMGVFHSDLIMPGDTWDKKFDATGKNSYFCMVHPWMTGSVTVN